jgi:DNA mismatch repair ATPase MutL
VEDWQSRGVRVLALPVSQPSDLYFRQKSVSRPLGTTIKVIDFLKSVPVRKQAALKNTIKTLSNIKRLLQSYALARPAVRLSLKILKAKDTKADWTFAPGQRGSLDDAVLKIIDKDTRGECVLESYVESGEEDTSDLEKDGFKLEAVLPRKDPGQINVFQQRS